ncbi:MAG: zf-TFIIB domain-containing protein [Planctomycetota bacterium]
MLIACHDCHQQFDVGAHRHGAVVRCFCGAPITVPEPIAKDLVMQHCSACGAGIAADAKVCHFCETAVSASDRGFGEVCPECLHRMVKGASFCSSCGVKIAPATLAAAMLDHSCPRCREPLSARRAGNVEFAECRQCAGLWLHESTVQDLVADREKSAAPAIIQASVPRPQPTTEVAGPQTFYIPCPVCGERMHRQNFARVSGIILDWCKGHGFWFDAEELDRVLTFVRNGGMAKAREREAQDLETGRRDLERRSMPARRGLGGEHATSRSFVDGLLEVIVAVFRRLF